MEHLEESIRSEIPEQLIKSLEIQHDTRNALVKVGLVMSWNAWFYYADNYKFITKTIGQIWDRDPIPKNYLCIYLV